jgi:hypothetical protein
MKKTNFEFLLTEDYYGSNLLIVQSDFSLLETIEQLGGLKAEIEVVSYKEIELMKDEEPDVTIEKQIRFKNELNYKNN